MRAPALTNDDKRERAFVELKSQVGLKPHDIIRSDFDTLLSIAKLGGIHAEERARRIRLAAEMTIEDFNGDLQSVLNLPTQEAKKMLRRFPSIGEPGADKILLFTGTIPILSLESNGLRTLLRIGFGTEQKSYAASYHSVQKAVVDELPLDTDWIINAYQVLRRHGKETCRTNCPACHRCPVYEFCDYLSLQRQT